MLVGTMLVGRLGVYLLSSLRRGHANILCIVPILTDDPRRESSTAVFFFTAVFVCFHAMRLTGKLIGAGSGRVYSGRYWQPPRLAQVSLVKETAKVYLVVCGLEGPVKEFLLVVRARGARLEFLYVVL